MTTTTKSEADVLTETPFYFEESDLCVECDKPFSAADASEGIVWIHESPAHRKCADEVAERMSGNDRRGYDVFAGRAI